VTAGGGEAAMTDEATSAQRVIGSVDRALLALQRLSEVGMDGLPLHRLAADLGRNKASLHHTLSALRHRGFVEQDKNGNYRLGASALGLADSLMRDDGLCFIHDALKELCLQVGEICHLGVLVGEDIVYTGKVAPKTSINTWSTVGFRNPALTTALGRAILSHTYVDFDSFAHAFPTPLFQRTPHTLMSLKGVWQELVDARRRGFSREIDEYAVGTSCLAVAILRRHRAIAAISITGPTERLDARREQLLVRTLRECVTPHLRLGLSLQMPTETRLLHAS
jgi:IclR family acetate operon transcriptional repressor